MLTLFFPLLVFGGGGRYGMIHVPLPDRGVYPSLFAISAYGRISCLDRSPGPPLLVNLLTASPHDFTESHPFFRHIFSMPGLCGVFSLCPLKSPTVLSLSTFTRTQPDFSLSQAVLLRLEWLLSVCLRRSL